MFLIKPQWKGLRILTPKQMLQRLPKALAQIKRGNTSENILNEIRHIYYLYQAKEITKKVFKNIMNSIRYNTNWILYLWTLNLWIYEQ